jgi:hypothetical protein
MHFSISDESSPLSSNGDCFVGFVETSIGMQSFRVHKSLKFSTHFNPDSLRLDDELEFIFSFCKPNTSRPFSSSFSEESRTILRIVQESTSIAQMSKDIEILANSTIAKYNIRNQSPIYNPAISHSSQVLTAHIENIGLNYIESVNSSMTAIKLKIPDSSNRIHFVEVILSSDYPRYVILF